MKNLIVNHKWSFYSFTLFNMLVPLINIAFAYSIKFIIDSGMSGNQSSLNEAIIVGIIVIFVYAGLNYMSFRFRNKLVRSFMNSYIDSVFKDILHKDYKNFSSENSGKFISLLTDNMKKVEEDYLIQFFNITRNLSLMIFSLIAMFKVNWQLTLFVIVASIIPMMISGGIGKKSSELQKVNMNAEQKYLTKVKDILMGFLVIKSFNVKDVIINDFVGEREKLSSVKLKKDGFEIMARVLS